MGHHQFEMISLPNVTLVAATSEDFEASALALRIPSYEIEFGTIKFLYTEPFSACEPKKIETITRLAPFFSIGSWTQGSDFLRCN